MKNISIIIPTYNKGGRIALTLKSLCQQETKIPYEVIVVDSGEQGNSELDRFRYTLDMKVIRTKNFGRSSNRNLGVKAAEGDLIIFCDDDLIAEPSFVNSHFIHHNRMSGLLVHGQKNEIPYVKFWEDPRKPEKGMLKEYKYRELSGEMLKYKIDEQDIVSNMCKIRSYGHSIDYLEKLTRHMFENGIENYTIPWIASCTANMSLHKSLIVEAGLFDESFGIEWGPEDLEFGYRVFKSGGKFSIEEKAQNYHIAHARRDWRNIAIKGFEKFIRLYPEESKIIKLSNMLIDRCVDIEEFRM